MNAFTTIPVAITPIITSYNPNAYVDGNGNEIGELKFTIIDPGPEENYYQLRLYDPQSGNIFFNSNDPALGINEPSGLAEGFSGVPEATFDDHLFNGTERSISLTLESMFVSPGPGLWVELISMDRSAYLYDQSLLLQENAAGNPFAEPAPVFDNIENGYGIFGSLAVARDTIF